MSLVWPLISPQDWEANWVTPLDFALLRGARVVRDMRRLAITCAAGGTALMGLAHVIGAR
ncbi:MAG: hypothetical protein JOY71_13630 [Acetobacteraceae bacterium]|nr:hypothetical protein [Acetobacteraceae bacterium]